MKTIFSILILFLALNCISQDYIPFPDSNATWKTVEKPYPPGPIPWYWAHYDYILEGDTIINNQNYSKLNRIDYDIHCSLEFTGPYYSGGIRNDISQKKVYYFPQNGTQEYLLYDFDLKIGDTIPLTYNNFDYPRLYVEDIDSILIGDFLRRTFICGYRRDRRPVNIIEGIGAETGLLEPMSYGEQDHYTKCFYQNDTQLYLYPGDTSCYLETDTCIYVGVNDNISTDIGLFLYPNPASDLIHITFRQNKMNRFPSQGRELEIFNVFGEKVLAIKMSIFQESYTQNITNLAPGLYLVVIRERQKIVSSGKFLIAR